MKSYVDQLQEDLSEANKRIEQLENALRNCDFWLDENACGACHVPPTADVLDVPEAVHNAVTNLYIALAKAKRS